MYVKRLLIMETRSAKRIEWRVAVVDTVEAEAAAAAPASVAAAFSVSLLFSIYYVLSQRHWFVLLDALVVHRGRTLSTPATASTASASTTAFLLH